MQFVEFNPGHLKLIRAMLISQSLARMGHQVSKLNNTPACNITMFPSRMCASCTFTVVRVWVVSVLIFWGGGAMCSIM